MTDLYVANFLCFEENEPLFLELSLGAKRVLDELSEAIRQAVND